MKIYLLKQNISDQNALDQGIALAKKAGESIGLSLDFIFRDTNKQFSSFIYQKNLQLVNPTEIFQEGVRLGYVFEEDAIACLIYDWNFVFPQPTNPAMLGLTMQIPIQFYIDTTVTPNVSYPEVFAQYFFHELSHYYLGKNNKPDITHNYDPAFSQKPRIDWYLYLIKPFVKVAPVVPPPVAPKYKWFKPSTDPKMVGLKHELMLVLDELRERCGFSITITSGLRTEAENNQLPDAVEDSAHLSGLGADVYCIDSSRRDKILNILKDLGVKRRGIGKTFIHLDIDTSKPQSVVWLYKCKN